VSAAIIAAGVLILLGYLMLGDRKRERSARSIRLGDDAASVATRMGGEGAKCPVGDLAHLQNAFPPNTPRPTAEEEIAGLRGRTATRWVYGDDGCTPESGDTEVGFTSAGRVVWVVRTHGTTPITM
jgi:hypothetical protein